MGAGGLNELNVIDKFCERERTRLVTIKFDNCFFVYSLSRPWFIVRTAIRRNWPAILIWGGVHYACCNHAGMGQSLIDDVVLRGGFELCLSNYK
ncbi:hypothetical protein D3C76_817530 [compost metagenome]